MRPGSSRPRSRSRSRSRPRLLTVLVAAVLTTLLGWSCLLAPSALASQADFDAGVAATRAGDPDGAVAAFGAALASGDVDPAVYHGLGNALYRQDHLGLAAAAWLRGLQLSPTDGDLTANLGHLRKQTQDRLDLPKLRSGPFFWQAAVSAGGEALLAGVLACGGLSLLLVGLIRSRGQQRRQRWLRGEVISLLGLAAIVAISAAVHAARLPPAVVTAGQVSVRSALGAEGVELFVLHEGAIVGTAERYGGEGEPGAAVLLELPDGRKGWVPAAAVDVADPTAPFPLPE